MKTYETYQSEHHKVCEAVANYSRTCIIPDMFPDETIAASQDDIRVIELFAGVGGFRIGLERASERFKTVWNNQWEPSTKRQDASVIYCRNFGASGHCNQDIATVSVDDIPDADMLVGGFPCQDYSVATTLKHSGGIEGKKGGRDFALILASLSDLGYNAEWRVINAAEYGMPQRRRRTYIFAFSNRTKIASKAADPWRWIESEGIMAASFPVKDEYAKRNDFAIEGSLPEISENFNAGKTTSPFANSGIMTGRHVYTEALTPDHAGLSILLRDILVHEAEVQEDFFIPDQEVGKWRYAKGGKKEKRINKATGFEYNYSEGAMSFPDSTDKPSRTIITGEGGSSPSRFKHVVKTESGRYRRLVPIELERLNMFPDNHTEGASDSRRAFLMGNALVTGIVERIGVRLANLI